MPTAIAISDDVPAPSSALHPPLEIGLHVPARQACPAPQLVPSGASRARSHVAPVCVASQTVA